MAGEITMVKAVLPSPICNFKFSIFNFQFPPNRSFASHRATLYLPAVVSDHVLLSPRAFR